jgi:hypothetical protein
MTVHLGQRFLCWRKEWHVCADVVIGKFGKFVCAYDRFGRKFFYTQIIQVE